jgi:hypothetical protein
LLFIININISISRATTMAARKILGMDSGVTTQEGEEDWSSIMGFRLVMLGSWEVPQKVVLCSTDRAGRP